MGKFKKKVDYWWIQSVYVQPENRGKGVYRSMYDHVYKLAKDAGAASIRLYVEHDNEVAKKTYIKCGMEQSHYHMYEQDLLKN